MWREAGQQQEACEQRAGSLGERFRARYGETPYVYRAPGRVNLIGEHTDYNGGFVLPAAIQQSCWVAAAPRGDSTLAVYSEAFGQSREWSLGEIRASPERGWGDYVRGVAVQLGARGYAVPGASLVVSSELPPGAGLSSSGALEVAVAVALLDLTGASAGPLDLAVICQSAENDYAGARCGLMDQLTALCAREKHAVLIDCRSASWSYHRLPSNVRLIACNSMVRHRNAAGEYNRRRAECEAVGFSLRDVCVPDVGDRTAHLPDVLRRRARHVVSENERVLAAAAALDRGALDELGSLMNESHRSLRDDFDVSCPELDLLVDLARDVSGVWGARMTGAGFGGCTVNIVAAAAVDDFCRYVGTRYEAKTSRRPEMYVSTASGAASREC